MTREEYVELCLENYVEKESGKVLSTNDFTSALKNKLDGIADNAQVNVIENISVDGVNQSIANKTVTLDLSDYVKNTEIASVLIYCGSVNSFSNLPNNALIGDVYNIITAGGTDANGTAVKAGDNVAYNGTGWDVLAGTVDLSGYVVKDGTKVLSTNDFTAAYKTKLDGIDSNAQVNVIETVKVNNTALTPSNKAVNIDLSGYVAKDGSKVLSTNDYTTAEKTKLGGIATGAQVNVIETVKLNGTALNVTNKAVDIVIGASSIVTLGTTPQTVEGALWLEWS